MVYARPIIARLKHLWSVLLSKDGSELNLPTVRLRLYTIFFENKVSKSVIQQLGMAKKMLLQRSMVLMKKPMHAFHNTSQTYFKPITASPCHSTLPYQRI